MLLFYSHAVLCCADPRRRESRASASASRPPWRSWPRLWYRPKARGRRRVDASAKEAQEHNRDLKMRRMDPLNVTDFSVHGLAAHAAKHETSLLTGVWVGLSLGTILTCCCLYNMCFQCMCGKGVTLSARPPVREYEGLPLITFNQVGRR